MTSAPRKRKAKPSRIEALAMRWAKAYVELIESDSSITGWRKLYDAEALAFATLRETCIRSLSRSKKAKR